MSDEAKELGIRVPPPSGGMRLTGTFEVEDWTVRIDVPFTATGDVVAALRLTADRLEAEGYTPEDSKKKGGEKT